MGTGRFDSAEMSKIFDDAARKHGVTSEYLKEQIDIDYSDMLADDKMNFFFTNFNPKRHDRILDVGCCFGTHIGLLSQKYRDRTFVGSDIEHSYIDVAKKLFKSSNCTFKCTDILNSDEFKPNTFDHIFFFEVIEHVDCPAAFIKRFYSLLKKGGRLYVSTPAALGITNILFNLKHRSLGFIEKQPQGTGTEKDHIYIWDKLTLFRLMHRNGFKLHKFKTSRKLSIAGGQSLCFIVQK
jgi:2-polyprenyl-3-methyl-5-hydroxy-6-metoxy-1,4-benzoquinol methylase